jgi:hypothetical protein
MERAITVFQFIDKNPEVQSNEEIDSRSLNLQGMGFLLSEVNR